MFRYKRYDRVIRHRVYACVLLHRALNPSKKDWGVQLSTERRSERVCDGGAWRVPLQRAALWSLLIVVLSGWPIGPFFILRVPGIYYGLYEQENEGLGAQWHIDDFRPIVSYYCWRYSCTLRWASPSKWRYWPVTLAPLNCFKDARVPLLMHHQVFSMSRHVQTACGSLFISYYYYLFCPPTVV